MLLTHLARLRTSYRKVRQVYKKTQKTPVDQEACFAQQNSPADALERPPCLPKNVQALGLLAELIKRDAGGKSRF